MERNKVKEVSRTAGRVVAVFVVTGTLLVPSFCSVDPTATVYADGEQTPTPSATATEEVTATPTPENWGGQGDDEDL